MPSVQDEYVKGKAVIAHGAGSTADFVQRAFGGPLAAIGYELVSWDRRVAVSAAADELGALVARTKATVVGGISVGAILATRFALSPAGAALNGLLVALPPPPGQPAPADSEDPGQVPDIQNLVDEVCRTAVPWVAQEIRSSWLTYEPADLIRELRTASTAMPPTQDALSRCRIPTGIVALADDPVHPVEVATMWAQAIPHAAVETVHLYEPGDDVSVLGAAAVHAWQRAQSVTGSR
jgi:pimeloyl-ACP methyl ester carboxylesterase